MNLSARQVRDIRPILESPFVVRFWRNSSNRPATVVAPDHRLLRRNALAQNLGKPAAPILNEDGQCFQGRGIDSLAEMALRETLRDGLFFTRRVNAKPEKVVGQLHDGESRSEE